MRLRRDMVLFHLLMSTESQIPLPVILPQRRPKDRTRGFVRAYAPVLENVGIDQATWLAFLGTFQLPSEASPWLAAIKSGEFCDDGYAASGRDFGFSCYSTIYEVCGEFSESEAVSHLLPRNQNFSSK
jgi:hypothetical protein